MSYGCPACNGLQPLTKQCPQCSLSMRDGGRADDYLGPYSPYRSADDLALSDGYAGLNAQTCVHQLFCEACGFAAAAEIEEWRM